MRVKEGLTFTLLRQTFYLNNFRIIKWLYYIYIGISDFLFFAFLGLSLWKKRLFQRRLNS